MECLDPVCEALSFLPGPLMVLVIGTMFLAPVFGVFFLLPWLARRKRARLAPPPPQEIRHSASTHLEALLASNIPLPQPLTQQPSAYAGVVEADDEADEPPATEASGEGDEDVTFELGDEMAFEEFAMMWLNSRDDNPHILLNGNTGAGKTITAEALGLICIAQGDQVLVINPNHKKGQWSDNVVTVDDEGDLDTIEATFKWLLWEIKRRANVLKTQGGDALQWMTVFWDELPETIEDLKIAAEFLRRALRRGRAIKIAVVGIVQLDTAGETGLKGRAGLMRGFQHMLLGKTAIMADPQLFDGVDRPALLLWQGHKYPVDRTGLKTLVDDNEFDAEAFVKPDISVVSSVDTIKWTSRHVKAAAMISGGKDVSITSLTKALYPKSKGQGPYREKVKAILAEVRAALLASEKEAAKANGPASAADDDDDYDDGPSEISHGVDGTLELAVGDGPRG